MSRECRRTGCAGSAVPGQAYCRQSPPASCPERMQFSPVHFQQSAGLTYYYNSKNWSYCFVDYEEGKGRTI
ncbi:hypothetical protein EGM92_25440, partial [Enterobacter cloacae]